MSATQRFVLSATRRETSGRLHQPSAITSGGRPSTVASLRGCPGTSRADENRIADITPKLDSEEYQKARHQRNLLAVLNTVTNRLEGRRKRRDLYQQKLDSAESQIAGAREFLERDAG